MRLKEVSFGCVYWNTVFVAFGLNLVYVYFESVFFIWWQYYDVLQFSVSHDPYEDLMLKKQL